MLLVNLEDALECLKGDVTGISIEDFVLETTKKLAKLKKVDVLSDIPIADANNTNMHEPLITSGYIEGWNDCRYFVFRLAEKLDLNNEE